MVKRTQPVRAIHHQYRDALVPLLKDDRTGLRRLWRIAHGELRSVGPVLVFSADTRNELRQFSKVPQLFAPAGGVRAAGRRQNINARAVEQLFLHAKFTFSL